MRETGSRCWFERCQRAGANVAGKGAVGQREPAAPKGSSGPLYAPGYNRALTIRIALLVLALVPASTLAQAPAPAAPVTAKKRY